MQPKKLKKDAIVEAVCEIQFDTELPFEIIVGRLSDSSLLDSFKGSRLPAAEIPEPVRFADRQLKYQSLLQFKHDKCPFLVNIGSHVLSYHNVGQHKYVGWLEFQPLLNEMVGMFFKCAPDATPTRLGFRYSNAFNKEDHFVSSVKDLNIKITDGLGKDLDKLNLNYLIDNDETHQTLVRIATSEFVRGNLPQNMTTFVDIDVSNKHSVVDYTKEAIIDWIDKAHSFEKEVFFSMLPKEIQVKLVEE